MASNGHAIGKLHEQERLGFGECKENGRVYQKWHRGQYLFPIDEVELDRLDAMHKFFLVARRNDLYSPHIGLDPKSRTDLRILDLGCGTGIWALDTAKDFYQNDKSFVMGVDLSLQMQAESMYENNKFEAMDIEEPWLPTIGEGAWHLIHARMLAGSISSWQRLYNRIFAHLIPGTGWLEHVEIDWNPCNDEGPVSDRLRHWAVQLLGAMDRAGRPLRIDPQATQQMLANAGFIEIKQEVIRIPVNGGSEVPYEIDVGRWFNLCFHKSIEGLSLAPLYRIYGWQKDQINALAKDVLEEIGERKNRSYCKLYIWTARRPPHHFAKPEFQ